MNDNVKAWKEKVVIPTYEIGPPEKYPFFLENRVYQGSSGVVYPNPVVEKISDKPVNKEWNAIYIENKYLKIMVLPQLGGRIQMAYDKLKERHFVYYNQVIKPALVGLTGPWISGGIEFNWPQHHRPSTYDPVDSCIEKNEDGSITIWVSEIERMFRTKGMAGFTLYPDKAYLEVEGRLYNRTPHPQTFLWWANPAVAVNDHYQSVFPPDVHAVFDHGKRDVSEFPIAKGEYYKVDYSPGTDISLYKNIPVPTSYMAITSKYDFVGGYENDSQAGLLHVADHNISPGKKQWTWGNGDFGHAWDRNLTEEDGPYIELMCGVYTDNQPDFSWMHPYEEKSFKQYFMPYQHIGVVKNATKEALVNIEIENSKAILKIYVTADYPNCKIQLLENKKILFEERKGLSPEKKYEQVINIEKKNLQNLRFVLKDKEENILLTWKPEPNEEQEIPEAAKPAKEPKDIESIEQLYLTGLHLEQYRHATYDPTAYYLEALSRNGGDARSNNAMGLWYLKRGKFEQALEFFERAIETLTERNPNPYDGEPFFNKGLCLNFLNRKEDSYAAFFKACWNAPWKDAGYFHLAQIDCSNGSYKKALEKIDKALIRNSHNHKALHLKVVLLRKSGNHEDSSLLATASLKTDNFNFGILFEKYLITNSQKDLAHFRELIRDNEHNYIEVAIDYAEAGLYMEAIDLLQICIEEKQQAYPMIYYLLADYYSRIGDRAKSSYYYQMAGSMSIDYCFPNRLEEVTVLSRAIEINPKDAQAYYYLGNFWYASKQYDNAQECWEASIKLNKKNPICHRNLALLYFNKKGAKEMAKVHLEKAFSLDRNNARVLMELDQLYKRMNISAEDRLEQLEENIDLCISRDDLYLERITLYNLLDKSTTALKLIEKRKFHPWEGGEGKVPFQYVTANVEIAKKYISQNKFPQAIEHLERAKIYPANLGEGKLYGVQENDIDYWLGMAYERMQDTSKSFKYFKKASEGPNVLNPAIFYNDQQPDKVLYQGLALLKLNKREEGHKRFKEMIEYGKSHILDDVKIDYFAISLPNLLIWEDDLNKQNRIHSLYLIGLGNFGLGNLDKASEALNEILSINNCHLAAAIHLKMLMNNMCELSK